LDRTAKAAHRLRLLNALLLAFGALSLWALAEHGYWGVWAEGFRSPGTMQILADLGIGMLLVSSWMVRDARQRKKPVGPWLVATVFLGSFAPLAYLWLREKEALAEAG